MMSKNNEVIYKSENVKFMLNDDIHSFKTISAKTWDSLKERILSEMNTHIIRLSIYCSESQNLVHYRNELETLFSSYLPYPAIEVLAQKPLEDGHFVAMFWVSEGNNILNEQIDNWKVVSVTVPNGTDNCDKNMQSALSKISSQLEESGLNYEDVIRTWIYIGNITKINNDVENYEAINLSRKNYYDGIFNPQKQREYPASTGIGLDNGDLTITALAYKASKPYNSVTSIGNTMQTEAWDYPSSLAKIAPTFSRAFRISTSSGILSLISGTASIIGADTVHENDIESQTNVTIDNIERVVESSIHQISSNFPLNYIIQYVCYIKNPEDLDKVRDICNSRLPISANRVFVKADVCRDNLLVEIEAIMYEPLSSITK